MNPIIKKIKKETKKELLKLRKEEEVISPAIAKEYQNIEILFAEDILDTKFPESFRRFLLKKEESFVGKQEILGLPTNEKTISILEATKYLRIKRPSLLPVLIVISLAKDCAFCIDVLNGNKIDAPIVKVLFKKETAPVLFSKSFKRFMEKSEKVTNQPDVKNLEASHGVKIIQ